MTATLHNLTLRCVRAILKNEDGQVLLARRSQRTVLPGLWELAGGKIDAGEKAHDAIVRETMEELGIYIVVGASFDEHWDTFEGRPIHTQLFEAAIARCTVPTLNPREHDMWGWFDPLGLPQKMTSTTAFALGTQRAA